MNALYNFFVLVISVLSVHLITGGITEYLMKYRGVTHPLKFTLIGMIMTAVILFPAFRYMDRIVKSITGNLLKKGFSRFGGMIGIFIVFLLMFSVLYWFYAYHWFHIDVLRVAINYLR